MSHLKKVYPNEIVSLDCFAFCEVVCRRGGLSGLCRGGKTFGGLVLKRQYDGYSVSNIFEGSFTEEVTVSVKSIFEGGFKFSSS